MSAERLAAEALGPCGVEVVALLAEFESFTPAAWDAARDAVRDAMASDARDDVWYAAYHAARDAVRDAVRDDAWDAAWDAAGGGGGSAVLATLVRDLITPEQYETLMTPVEAARAVMRETDSTTTPRSDK